MARPGIDGTLLRRMRSLYLGIVCLGWVAFACSAREQQGEPSSGGATVVANGGGTLGGSGGVVASGGVGVTAGGSSSSSAGSTTAVQTSGGAPAQGGATQSFSGSPGAGGSTGGTASAGGVGAGGSSAGAPGVSGGAPAAGGTNSAGNGGAADSLKDKYAPLFPIGAAVDSQSYMTHAALLSKHFNSVTPENDMKFDALEPSEGKFSYAAADRIVDYATRNNMKIRGHTMVWHSQNPDWLFKNSSGGTVSADVLLMRMKNHIDNVAKHFHGKVYAWDVVNEAIMEDGSFRNGNEPDGKQSQWYAIIGESYIAQAFQFAHAADPDAKLFYNDFYDYIPAKQQAIYNMLKKLLDAGVPVHGVGMQCHLNIQPSTDPMNQGYYQTVENLENAIKLYSSLGIAVQVTELDLSLYVPGVMYTQDQFYTTATFTDALKNQQADRYRAFFELFRKYSSVITGVTFWGIADDNTWLSEFSSGRKDFPLLFDVNHQPKPAYYSVVGF